MDTNLLRRLLYLYFAAQTWCIILALELLLTGIPYLSLFAVIFATMLYLHRDLLHKSMTRKRSSLL